jgi:class 3 adenylate cyclase/tetratricopeptide (TPR) repeat protein
MAQAGTPSERRVVTVLFADIAGFTALSEILDPEVVTDAVNEIFSLLGAEVEAVGGHVDKVVGDELMALFGAPIAHEDDAHRAVRSGVAMQRAMQTHAERLARVLGRPPQLRVGIHSGQVIWGAVGPPGQTQPTVMGDAVNVASRLQRAAPEGGVLISEAVWRQVRGTYTCKDWEPIVVKGKSGPLAVYEVIGEREKPEAIDRPPFVGRRQDLDQLADLLGRARRGRAQVVVTSGDPGVGKTRLVEEFVERLPAEIRLLKTACPPYGGASLQPLADLFRQFARLEPAATLGEIEARLPMGDRAAQAARIVSRLFGLTDVPADDEVTRDTALLIAAEAIRRMLTEPTVVWIEDLQWADAGTRDLLPFFVERLTDTPLLVVGTIRSEEEPPAWGRRTSLTTMHLEPLDDEESRTLLRAVAGQALPADAEQTILAKAAGNPFYLSEIVATLRTRGIVVPDDRGRWHLTQPIVDVLPDTVHGAVLARLDRLPSQARSVAQHAAVVGNRFRRSLLAALLPDTEIADPLRDLEDAYLIRRDDPLAVDPEYAFVHPLVREVAYASLLVKRREALHRLVAQTLEQLPDRSDSLAKVIGTHYEKGAEPQRALPHLLTAGKDALERYASREALELLERVRDLARSTGDPEHEAAACELLGELYLHVQERGPKDRIDAWRTVVATATAHGESIRQARAAIRAAEALADDNDVGSAEGHLEEAAALLPADHLLWSEYHRTRARLHILRSEYEGALLEAQRAVAIVDRLGSHQDRARAYSVLGHPAVLPLLGDAGRATMQRWLNQVASLGDERLLSEARHLVLTDLWTRSIVDDDLLRLAEEAARKAAEFGWTREEADNHMLLGWANFLIGRWGDADRHLQHVWDLLQASGARPHILLPYFRASLAMGRGLLDQARQILEEALRHARFHQPIWLNHDLARCLWMDGDLDGAREAMTRALEARDRLNCIICGCQAAGVAAEFYATTGDTARAQALSAQAQEVATRIGHIATQVRLRRAEAHLAMAAGDAARAVYDAQAALDLGARLPIPQPFEQAQSLVVLGSALRPADPNRALGVLHEAREVFDGLGASWHSAQVETALRQIGAPA